MPSHFLPVSLAWAFVLALACSPGEADTGAETENRSSGGTESDQSSNGGSSSAGGSSGGAPHQAGATPSGGALGSGGTGGTTKTPGSGGGDGMGGMGGGGSDAAFFPSNLTVARSSGEGPGLTLTAYTLREGSGGLEAYVAVRNTGDHAACSVGISIEFYDSAEEFLASSTAGLLTQGIYRLADDPNQLLGCVAPGGLGMAALTDWPSDLVLEDLAYLVYRCPHFNIDVVAVDAFTLRQVESIRANSHTTYEGIFVNELDVTISEPQVTIFPVNHAGRPLARALATGTLEIPPGETWAFETEAVAQAGEDFVAYSTAAIPSPE